MYWMLRAEEQCDGPDMCPEACAPERCENCFLTRMEASMDSQVGMRVRAAFDLDFALRKGVRVGLDDIGALEFAALRVIDIERNKWEQEQAEKRRREAEEKARRKSPR